MPPISSTLMVILAITSTTSPRLCVILLTFGSRGYIDLHLDFKYCIQCKKVMAEICRICGVNFTLPKRFVSHRWLNAYDQAMETARLFDLYVIFYSVFLPVHLKGQYSKLVNSLIQRLETHGARERVRCLLSVCAASQKTKYV